MSRGPVSAASFACASSRMPFTPRVMILLKSGVQFCEWRMVDVPTTTAVQRTVFLGSGPNIMNRVSGGRAMANAVA